VFQTDIHPAAVFGKGLFLDHATGFVVGATSVVVDDVSILQNVTLGGTGNESADRHTLRSNGNFAGILADFLDDAEKLKATRHRLFLRVGCL